MEKLRLGISACLLGKRVRYDGHHKYDCFLCDELSNIVDWVPICPETECGLPIPREPSQLELVNGKILFRALSHSCDYTDLMIHYIAKKITAIKESADLQGFILKSGSPSCAPDNLPIFDESGKNIVENGAGMFGAALHHSIPELPLISDKAFHNRYFREGFVDQVLSGKRITEYLKNDGSLAGLVHFHNRHRMLIMLHAPGTMPLLSYITLHCKEETLMENRMNYFKIFRGALAVPVTPHKHQKVLFYAYEQLKNSLIGWERQEIVSAIQTIPIQPAMQNRAAVLLHHYARKFKCIELLEQYYWESGNHPLNG